MRRGTLLINHINHQSRRLIPSAFSYENNKNIYLFNAIEICTTNVTINKINNLIKEKKIQEAYTLLKRLNDTYPLNEKIQKDLIEMEKILKE